MAELLPRPRGAQLAALRTSGAAAKGGTARSIVASAAHGASAVPRPGQGAASCARRRTAACRSAPAGLPVLDGPRRHRWEGRRRGQGAGRLAAAQGDHGGVSFTAGIAVAARVAPPPHRTCAWRSCWLRVGPPPFLGSCAAALADDLADPPRGARVIRASTGSAHGGNGVPRATPQEPPLGASAAPASAR